MVEKDGINTRTVAEYLSAYAKHLEAEEAIERASYFCDDEKCFAIQERIHKIAETARILYDMKEWIVEPKRENDNLTLSLMRQDHTMPSEQAIKEGFGNSLPSNYPRPT